MKQEEEILKYTKILDIKLPLKIDKDFVNRYFGDMAIARMCLREPFDDKILEEALKKTNEVASNDIALENAIQVGFEDALLMHGLCGRNCTSIDFSTLTQSEFELIPFDSNTIFSKSTIEKFNPEEIIERGKKLGLGFESLGLTGKGIHVAVIDENCNPTLTDANIVQYYKRKKNRDGSVQIINIDLESDKDNPIEEHVQTEHMHGKTVTSLLASKSCGVAKDAKVHFFTGKVDKIFEEIIRYNNSATEEEKIRVVSCSMRIKANSQEFERISNALRESGCELICANNFDKYFSECMLEKDGTITPLGIYSSQDIARLKSEFPGKEDEIEKRLRNSTNNKKVRNSYKSNLSSSWRKSIF